MWSGEYQQRPKMWHLSQALKKIGLSNEKRWEETKDICGKEMPWAGKSSGKGTLVESTYDHVIPCGNSISYKSGDGL